MHPKASPGDLLQRTMSLWSDKCFWALLDLICRGAGICANDTANLSGVTLESR